MLDDLDDALQGFHVDAQHLRQLREVPLHEHLPVIADDRLHECVVDFEEFELQQQTLAQVARAHADRIERLDRAKSLRCFLG